MKKWSEIVQVVQEQNDKQKEKLIFQHNKTLANWDDAETDILTGIYDFKRSLMDRKMKEKVIIPNLLKKILKLTRDANLSDQELKTRLRPIEVMIAKELWCLGDVKLTITETGKIQPMGQIGLDIHETPISVDHLDQASDEKKMTPNSTFASIDRIVGNERKQKLISSIEITLTFGFRIDSKSSPQTKIENLDITPIDVVLTINQFGYGITVVNMTDDDSGYKKLFRTYDKAAEYIDEILALPYAD